MAVLKHSDIEERNADENFAQETMDIAPHFQAVRRATASVTDLLRRAGNPFETGEAGFAEIGLSMHDLQKCTNPFLDEAKTPNPEFRPEIFPILVPKIAEIAALLTCSKDELKAAWSDVSMEIFESLTFEFIDNHTKLEIIDMIEPVTGELYKVRRATAIIPEGDAESAVAEAAKKKLTPDSAPST